MSTRDSRGKRTVYDENKGVVGTNGISASTIGDARVIEVDIVG